MTRTRWGAAPAGAVLLCALLAACKAGAGDPCNGAGDCASGLYCDVLTRRCVATASDSGTPGSDAAPPGSDAITASDGAPDDAGAADAAPGIDAAPGTDASPGTDAAPGTDALPPGTDAAPPFVCGDLSCDSIAGGENCLTCALDCGACAGGSCGNGSCSGMETCVNCPGDCGSC